MHLDEVKTQQALRTQIIDALSKVIALGGYGLLRDVSQTFLNFSMERVYQSFKSLSLLYIHKYLYTHTQI